MGKNKKKKSLSVAAQNTAASPNSSVIKSTEKKSINSSQPVQVESKKKALDDLFASGKQQKIENEKIKKAEEQKVIAEKKKQKKVKKQIENSGNADDVLGNGPKWKDDGLGGIHDQNGWTNRTLNDGTGMKIYKAHLIGERDKPNAGNTPLCPFDCDCCFGFGEDGMEDFLKSVS